MSRHADAEPTIGPTRPARSRTTSVLSPAAAPAVPASNALNKNRLKRVVIANRREAKVQKYYRVDQLCRSVHMTFLSERIYRPNGDYPFRRGACTIEVLSLGSSSSVSPDLGRNLQFCAAEIERGSNAQVKIAQVRRDVDQLFGIELRSKGSAQHARHVSVYHSGKQVARLFDELGGGPIVWNRNYRFDGHRLRLQLFDGIIEVQGVSLVVEPHNHAFIGAECAHCLRDPFEPRVATASGGGDLPDWHSPQSPRVAHDGVGFQHITHKIVKYRAIG